MRAIIAHISSLLVHFGHVAVSSEEPARGAIPQL